MPVTERTYQTGALDDIEGLWELHDGLLVEKPSMGIEHNDITTYLAHYLILQLDSSRYRVHVNGPRLRRSARGYTTPDVRVIPAPLFRQGLG